MFHIELVKAVVKKVESRFASHKLLLMLGTIVFMSAQSTNADICWKHTYGRGGGILPGSCEGGNKDNASSCYPKCRDGYKGVSFVCWQQCPEGFRDDGAFCFKPKPYGRGVGYVLWKKTKCENENRDLGCEKCLLLYYPKCKSGFHAVGCNICSPDCPPGMKDIGISCAKDSYTRKTIIPNCGDKEYNAGLCYKRCEDSHSGVGPVCWSRCPPEMPVDCGAVCGKTAGDCADAIIAQVIDTGSFVKSIVEIIETAGAGAASNYASAAEALKVQAKTMAKQFQSKHPGLTVQQMDDELKVELRKRQVSEPTAIALAKMIAHPDNSNFEHLLKSLDTAGLIKIINTFNKTICPITSVSGPDTKDEVCEDLSEPPAGGQPPQADQSGALLSSLSSSGECLSNSCLVSGNGLYKACQQDDGHLVIYSNRTGSWKYVWGNQKIFPPPFPPSRLCMQGDGNLVSYKNDSEAYWSTGTAGQGVGPYNLSMQGDGNLVIYDKDGVAIWASNTMGK